MQVLYERCAGLDVHKKSIYACARWLDEKGERQQRIRSFGTVTAELLRLADWLREQIQDLRDLTRYRAELTQAQNRVANRIQKVLEQANIKLALVNKVVFYSGTHRMSSKRD